MVLISAFIVIGYFLNLVSSLLLYINIHFSVNFLHQTNKIGNPNSIIFINFIKKLGDFINRSKIIVWGRD